MIQKNIIFSLSLLTHHSQFQSGRICSFSFVSILLEYSYNYMCHCYYSDVSAIVPSSHLLVSGRVGNLLRFSNCTLDSIYNRCPKMAGGYNIQNAMNITIKMRILVQTNQCITIILHLKNSDKNFL